MIELKGYHTQEYRDTRLTFPALGEGHQQWFGEGYYFWESEEFAHWWGQDKKISQKKGVTRYSIYVATLKIESDEIVDTVFVEEDYRNFVRNVEKFANSYLKIFGKRPSLYEFNEFITDHKLWSNIRVIRFQDLPTTNKILMVGGFPYKKRIQIRIIDPEKITNFAHFFDSD